MKHDWLSTLAFLVIALPNPSFALDSQPLSPQVLVERRDPHGHLSELLERTSRMGKQGIRWMIETHAPGGESSRTETLWTKDGPLELTEIQEAPGRKITTVFSKPDLNRAPPDPDFEKLTPAAIREKYKKHADSSFFLKKVQFELRENGIVRVEWSRESSMKPWKKGFEGLEKSKVIQKKTSPLEQTQLCKDTSALCREDLKKFHRPCGEGTSHNVYSSRPELFCSGRTDPEAKVNPYALARLPDGAIDPICKAYLFARASVEAQEFLDSAPNFRLSSPQKKILRGARDALEFTAGPACHSVLQDGSQASLEVIAQSVTQISQVISLNRTVPDRDPKKTDALYCSAIESGCSALGGQMKEVPISKNGHHLSKGPDGNLKTIRSCVVGELLINSSCTSPEFFPKIKLAVQDLQSRAQPCLNSLSPDAGNQLRRMLKDPEYSKKSEICCGKCSNSPFPYPGGMEEGNTATQGFTNNKDTFASLVLTRAAFTFTSEKNQESLNGTLFHEMLHRIGMCSDERHDDQSLTNPALSEGYARPDSRGKCPSGFTLSKLCPNWLTQISTKPDEAVSCEESLVELQIRGLTSHKCSSKISSTRRSPNDYLDQLQSPECNPFAAILPSDALDSPEKIAETPICIKVSQIQSSPSESALALHAELLDPVYACEAACSLSGQKDRKQNRISLIKSKRYLLSLSPIPSSIEDLQTYQSQLQESDQLIRKLRAQESAKVCAQFASSDSTWSGRSLQEIQ